MTLLQISVLLIRSSCGWLLFLGGSLLLKPGKNTCRKAPACCRTVQPVQPSACRLGSGDADDGLMWTDRSSSTGEGEREVGGASGDAEPRPASTAQPAGIPGRPAVHHGRAAHRRGTMLCVSSCDGFFIICLIIFLAPQPLPVPQKPAQHLAAHKRLIVCMRVCRSLRRGRSPRGRLKALLLALASPPPPHFGEVCIRAAAEGGSGVTVRLARPPHPSPPPAPPPPHPHRPPATHSLTPFTQGSYDTPASTSCETPPRAA